MKKIIISDGELEVHPELNAAVSFYDEDGWDDYDTMTAQLESAAEGDWDSISNDVEEELNKLGYTIDWDADANSYEEGSNSITWKIKKVQE